MAADLTGMKFGRLTVVRKVSDDKPILWACICECGKAKITDSKSLKRKHVVSCGCKNEELRQVFKENFRKPIEIEIDGFTRTINEWSQISGVKASAIHSRLRRGWKNEDLLIPIHQRRKKLNVDENL